jgi:UDP-2,3-diacylglucosamine pyrophosphatase LpxH
MAGDIVAVVSDLHLGAGQFYAGNTLEDFTSDGAFASLLAALARESEQAGRPAALVVNGDFVEFLQVPRAAPFEPSLEYPPAEYVDMGPSASAQRLRTVVAGHAPLFAALREWLRVEAPRRRLVILRGNHDPHWYWSAVQEALREAVGAGAERRTLVEFPAPGYACGRAYIEHGNQYAEAANRFRDMAAPLAAGDPSQLETPWGSKFVIEFFNRVEREKYWVDGVKPVGALVWHALKYDPSFAFRTLVALLRAAPRLAGVRDEIRDSWLTNLQTNPEFASQRYRTSEAYRREIHALLAHALGEMDARADAALEPPGDADPQALAVQVQEAQDRCLIDGATQLAQARGASLVVLGHTHRPADMELRNGARYINTGCWVWQMDLGGASDARWRELFAHPAAYADRRRLTYVRLDLDDDGNVAASLLDYTPAQPVDRPPAGPGIARRAAALIRSLLARVRDLFPGRQPHNED